MKYKRLRFALLGLLVMLGALSGASAQTWVKTDPAELQTGDIVVIVDQTSATAMSNDQGTSKAPVATSVTLNDDKSEISGDVADNLQWEVTVADGSYKFGIAGKENYLYCINSNNGVRVGSNENNAFTITQGGDDNADFLKNTATNRYIGVYDSQDWRCYTSINANIRDCVTAFYKKTEGGQTDTRTATTISAGEDQTGEVGTTMNLPLAVVSDAAGAPVSGAAVTWTSSDETVAKVDGTTLQLLKVGTATITANFAGDDQYKPCQASFTMTVTAAPYTSIAAMLADITSTRTTATYQFENLLVTYVQGSNTFVSDGQNGFLFYGSDLGLNAGEKITGTATGQIYTYNGLPEMALTANGISAQVASEGNEVAWPAIAPADLANYINIPVTIENAVFVETGSGKNLTFKVGEETLAVYNNWIIDVTALEANHTYTLTGVGSVYAKGETTTYQLYLVSFEDKAEEPEPAGWRDIKVDLTNGNLLEESEKVQWGAVGPFGIAVAEDGTVSRVAADAANAACTVQGKWHSTNYGWSGLVVTVPVEGPVKVTYGLGDFSDDVIIMDEAGNETKFNIKGTTWNVNNPDRVAFAYYRGLEPTTLTISGGSYQTYFAIEAIDPADLPEEVTEYIVSFAKGDAEGIAPADIKVEAGQPAFMPANTTLYIEGKTLTGWEYEGQVYAAGEEITVTNDTQLTPVFTDNTVAFNDRTEEVTVTWDATQKTGGAPLIGIERATGFIVGQALVNGETIDMKLTIDASTAGKFNNSNGEWIQVNNGTKFILPACKGASYSIYTMGDSGENTFNGEKGEYANNYNTYTYDGNETTMEIVVGGGSWYKAITATYPVVEQQEEPVVEPSEFVFRDFQMDLRDANGGILTADEASNSQTVNFGISVDENNGVTRVEADAENTAAVITGVTGNNHGLQRFSATVPVEGPVQITMSTCSWGGDVTVKNAEGETVTTFTTKKGEGGSGCYQGNGMQDDNIVSAKYVGEATTLTIEGGAYVGFFAVQAIEASSVDVAYSLGDVECQGDIVPTGGTYAKGDEYTIPAQNFTLYKEGYTLTGWTDGENTYATGETITLAGDLNLTPVFTENKVNLSDRTEAVTLNFSFRRDQGAPIVQWQNQDNLVWVAQANVAGKIIDVALPFSTNPGKFNNTNWTDWCQLNNGTKFAVPSCKGATISIEAFNELGVATKEGQALLSIDGQTDYTTGKTVSYTIAGAAESVDVVIGEEGSYYRYIQVVLPKVEQQGGGETFDHVAGTINWPVGNEQQPVISDEIAGAISSASVSTGSELTIATAKYFDTDMVHYTPVNGNAGNVEGVMIEYRVKPAKGVTFQPTQVDYAAVKVGTDNATYSWSYTVDGQESTITQVDPKPDLLRNNGSNSVDNGGTAKLMHTETFPNVGECSEFTFRFYISACANNKNICIGNVTISGIVNGESVSVNMYELATAVAPAEAGSINVYPVSDQYEEGTEVTLTATENFGYDFVNWTNAAGEEVSTEAKFKYTMNADETLTANFVAVETYELALTVDGTNDYMVKISPAPEMVEGKMMYEAGTAVQLQADQYEGLVTFTNWSDGETNSSKLISINEDTEITAYYAQADIIAGWDFYTAGANGRKADFYAQDNDADALTLVNTESGETSGWLDKSTLGGGGYESFKGAAVNWRTGAKNGDVGNWHWQTKINAEAFTDINVQFQMLYNYNAYQTYNAEYSLDGENWTGFGSVTMNGTRQVGTFKQQLPTEANNQTELYLRMIADKNSKVDGTGSTNDGNTLAMFFITGTPKLVDDGTAPVLVSSVPADGATGASASGKIVLTFDERVKLADTFMPTATLGNQTLTPAVSGKTVTFEYKGLEYSTEYTFTLPGGSIADLTNNFIVDPITLSFTTMVRPSVTKGLYDYVVENVEDLVAAINQAATRNDQNTRYRIFIKNGEYILPRGAVKHYRHTNGKSGSEEVVYWEGDQTDPITYFNASNVSFIGESRDGVIITNDEPDDDDVTFTGQYGKASVFEGIGQSDVFQIGSRVSGLYWQDLTVETGMADSRGRDIAIHDRGTQNIYKNVGLRGYQDTWTSNNDNGLYYFEGGYVRGRTDYMCGKGDIFWNGVELRQIAGGYAAVPSKPAKYGWIYKDCVINGEGSGVDGNYTLGRPWGSGTPIALFIDTKMNVVPSAIGWNEMSGGWPARFAEYNSMTSTGSVIDLSGRKKTFGDGHANNPVLTAEEALENSDLHRMYGDWDPTLATEQAPIPSNVELNKGSKTLTWTDSNYALLYAIVKNGKVVDFTTEATYTVDDAEATWAVRAANEMGGLCEASEASITTGISEVANGEQAVPETIYNLNGVRVEKAQKGLYIINGRKVVVK